MVNMEINGRKVDVDVPAEMPLRWALRDELGMVGTKFGTTVKHIDTQAQGAAVQADWVAANVSQCGFCQGRQVMASLATPVSERASAMQTAHQSPTLFG